MKLHTQGNAAEMIWQGRVQIGDEPGVYGASYGGSSIEPPVTLTDYSGGGSGLGFHVRVDGRESEQLRPALPPDTR